MTPVSPVRCANSNPSYSSHPGHTYCYQLGVTATLSCPPASLTVTIPEANGIGILEVNVLPRPCELPPSTGQLINSFICTNELSSSLVQQKQLLMYSKWQQSKVLHPKCLYHCINECSAQCARSKHNAIPGIFLLLIFCLFTQVPDVRT